MTECTEPEIRTKGLGRRELVARFDGGDITSDAGALLLGEVEKRRKILSRLAACFAARVPSGLDFLPLLLNQIGSPESLPGG